MADVAVVGGRLVGLLTGILLARRGHQVVVVDSDEDPPGGSVEDDLNWPRPGVPQGWHGHVWQARVARVLREDTPDVLDALQARGVNRAGIDFGPGFEDDRALMARRPVVEAVLRRLVRAEPGLELLRTGQRVTGLDAQTTVRSGPTVRPLVIRVRLQGGERLPADLVVDCGGRRSIAPDWLRRIGSGLSVDEYMPCDLHYFARHYRLRPGAAFPVPAHHRTTPRSPRTVCSWWWPNNGTFCLAGALSKSDPCRQRFGEESRFDAVMAALPGLQP